MSPTTLTAAEVLKRNNVRVSGKGDQVMMFAHGFGCDQNMWRFIAPTFEEDYKVVLFDYVGSGNSDIKAYDVDRYSSLNGYAQDVLEICDALDLHDVIFVGHSVSSMVGVLAANQEPDRFEHLIMVGPSPSYINDGDYQGGFNREDIAQLIDLMERNFLGWASYLAPIIMKNSERGELSSELEKSFCSTDPKVAKRFAEATFYSDNRADVAKLATPSLIIQCSDDAIAPMQVGEYLKKHMPGSTMTVLDASGHCPHMSHPELTIEAIKKYLAEVYAE